MDDESTIDGSTTDTEASTLTQEEVSKILAQMEEVERDYEKLEFLTTPKMPCIECGGNGQLPAGVMGNISCPSCNGKRFVDQPGESAPFEMPDFRQLRADLIAYADRQLGPGAMTKERWAALPPAPPADRLLTMGKLEEMKAAFIELKRTHKPAPLPELPEGKKKRPAAGALGPADDDADDLSDDDLDNIEDAEFEDQ